MNMNELGQFKKNHSNEVRPGRRVFDALGEAEKLCPLGPLLESSTRASGSGTISFGSNLYQFCLGVTKRAILCNILCIVIHQPSNPKFKIKKKLCITLLETKLCRLRLQ